MTASPSVTVIGGGVMGCSVLFHLADQGVTDTALLEQESLAFGSTSRSQGVLRMHYSNAVTTQLAWDSLAAFQNFAEQVGSPSGYVRTGYLLAVPGQYGAAMRRNLFMQQDLGVDTGEVDADELSSIAPHVTTKPGEAYAYEPQSGYADAHLVTSGYARRASELGASVRTNTPVESIVVKGGRVTGVRVDGETLPTGAVVLAAGPWTGPLLTGLGVDAPMTTVRHQVLVVARPRELSHPTIGDVVNGFSGRPDGRGHSLIALGEDVNSLGLDGYNQHVDEAAITAGMSAMATRVPGMADAGFAGGWSGLFTVTPDWHPVIGPVPGIDGLYVAAGFSGHGFKMAPGIGRAMAEIVLGCDQTIDVGQLRPGRFSDDALLESAYPLRVLA
jgi:sarcosine oxidase, subunit beta